MSPTLLLEATAYTLDQLLALQEAQIALAGRSNVGKSSLVNALAGRKKLAKVSATPGKTRSVNFYRVEPQAFYLVDLPGYGYARASHEERRQWAHLLEHYLTESTSLRALALLLDSRLEPQKLDLDLAHFARQCRLPVIPVLTKADKCKQGQLSLRQNQWQEITGIRPVITSSSHKRGIAQLWEKLLAAADCAPQETDSQPLTQGHADAPSSDAAHSASDSGPAR